MSIFLKVLDIKGSRDLRTKYFIKALMPIFSLLKVAGITPNIITLFSIASGLLSVFFIFDNQIMYIIFFSLHLLFDSMDGVYARIFNASSSFGSSLDKWGDWIVMMLSYIKATLYFDATVGFIALCLFLIITGFIYLLKINKEMGPYGIFRFFIFFDVLIYGLYLDIFLYIFFFPIHAMILRNNRLHFNKQKFI